MSEIASSWKGYLDLQSNNPTNISKKKIQPMVLTFRFWLKKNLEKNETQIKEQSQYSLTIIRKHKFTGLAGFLHGCPVVPRSCFIIRKHKFTGLAGFLKKRNQHYIWSFSCMYLTITIKSFHTLTNLVIEITKKTL